MGIVLANYRSGDGAKARRGRDRKAAATPESDEKSTFH
jgi:hypothetical protein